MQRQDKHLNKLYHKINETLNALPLISSPTRNRPGMFDLLKGYCMLCIWTVHTLNGYDASLILESHSYVKNILICLDYLTMGCCLLTVFFMLSGYGFKKTDVAKTFKKQANLLLLPYVKIAGCGMILSAFIYLIYFRDISRSLGIARDTLISFVFGVTSYSEILGFQVLGIYTAWYLLALFFSWNIVNLVVKKLPEQFHFLTILLIALIGIAIGNRLPTYYALEPALVATLFLYCGHLIKKYDLLNRRIPILLYLIAAVLFLFQTYNSDVNMSTGFWEHGVIDMVVSIVCGFFIIRAFNYLNRFQNRLFDGIRYLGRYSLWLVCIHTVEYISIPWYRIVYFTSHHLVNVCIFFVARVLINLLGLQVLIFLKKRKK